MNDADVARYLERIGAKRPAEPSLEALRDLQIRHLRTVPFENLSLHLDEPVDLGVGALLGKIVTRRRGGFCYEVNGAFAWLLRRLGFQVTMLAAATYKGSVTGPPFDHMALRVDLDEPYLADVGFGRFAHYPLNLSERGEQADPGGRYLIRPEDDGDLTVLENDWAQYRLELRPRRLSDFGPTCWYQQTSPKSHFTRSLVCSRLTDNGRLSLSGDRLIHTMTGSRTETRFATEAELLAAYNDHFGIKLSRLPTDPKTVDEAA